MAPADDRERRPGAAGAPGQPEAPGRPTDNAARTSRSVQQGSDAEQRRRAPDAQSDAEGGGGQQRLLPSLTLPRGGGAIRGIDEKFSVNPATGTAGLSFPVATSPGRAGFSLSLALAYDSGSGNGPWGVGWSFSAPAVTRKTAKGLPRFADEEDSDVFLLSGTEDLVPARTPSGLLEEFEREGYLVRRFRPRTEGSFLRIERWTERATGDVQWRVTTPNNVLNIYGRTPNARIADPMAPQRVFSWLLEETRDDRGNIARYSYKAEDGAGVDPSTPSEFNRFHHEGEAQHFDVTAQRYLKRIQYGNRAPIAPDEAAPSDPNAWLFEVVFDYGEHHLEEPTPTETRAWPVRLDPFSDYRATFEVRTYRLCRRVLMFHRFDELGPEPVLVSSTDLTYEESPVLTYLRGATHAGYLRDSETGRFERQVLPTLELDYTRARIHDEVHTLQTEALEGITGGIDGNRARWVDLNGEGIAGVLVARDRDWLYKGNLGEGQLAPPQRLRNLPHPAALTSGAAELTDLGGDGNLDLVACVSPLPGYFERTDDQTFAPFVAFRDLPNLNWSDPNLRFVDLDGDGHPDVLITEDDAFVWYRSKTKEGFGRGGTIPTAKDELTGPAVVFADGTETIQLADMSGDGLVDIVRVRNGEISYWPNLGYGRFGRKVTLDRSPRFDHLDQYDPNRIHFADIDGSGTSDIIYLGRDGVRLYFNESGNALSTATHLESLPPIDSLSTLTVTDLLGTGTATLVWSSPLGSESRQRITYVDLMGGVKPHLLASVVNNLGAETQVTYAPSTKFYLADKAEGKPWLTRLHFPVQVVERIERFDHISKSRLVTTHSYHHGYYDGVEREFRGFARVEQRDAEKYETSEGTELYQAPVRTVSWFHTGAWLEKERLESALQKEYFQGGPPALLLADTILPPGLSIEDERQAARALRGALLRSEVYAEDSTELTALPYTVTESSYEVRRLQSAADAPAGLNRDRYGVFFVHPRETVTVHTERNPRDPRVMHELVLDVDDYGNVTRSVSVAYARPSAPLAEQAKAWATLRETDFINEAEQEDWYRVSVQYQSRSYEVTGLALPEGGKALASLKELRVTLDALNPAKDLPYETDGDGSTVQRRLLDHQQQVFYADDLTTPLPLGDIQSLALPYQTYQLAFSRGLVRELADTASELTATTVTSDDLTTLLLGDGAFVQRGDDGFWAPSGRVIYDPSHFYAPVEAIDPFGNHSSVAYDSYALFVTETRDPLDNVATAQHDYRVLQPRLITDPNLNRAAVAFDALGKVVAAAVMGKDGADEGDTIEDPTTRLEYDYLRWQRERLPTFVHTFAREQHGAANPRWQEGYTYSDGFGRMVMQKLQAEPGEAPLRDGSGALQRDSDGGLALGHLEARWVGTGRTIFNNKGNPVKQYEPFFSSTSNFEDEDDLVEWGVTPIIHYDPLDRVVRTDLPNGTLSRVEFGAWNQTSWDPSDTVLESDWYAARGTPNPRGPEPQDPEKRAAWLSAQHANTPSITHLDALGRTFLAQADNGPEPDEPDGPHRLYDTRTLLDIGGNPLRVTDALGHHTITQRFDVLARRFRVTSLEGGTRLMLSDVAGKPLRRWDSRRQVQRLRYDARQRPTHHFILDEHGERLVQRTVYGESLDLPTAQEQNLRGQAYLVFDQAGVATSVRFDFKGNLLEAVRHLARPEVDPARKTIAADWTAIAELADTLEIATAAESLLQPDDPTQRSLFLARTAYDALNRVVEASTPDNSITRPRYNEANLLDGVDVLVRGEGDFRPIVRDLSYNARGQRLSATYANPNEAGITSHTTTYTYDDRTFRLIELRTVRKSDGKKLQRLLYTFDAVGNIAEQRDDFTWDIVFATTPRDGSSRYRYDGINRLIEATGREHHANAAAELQPLFDGPRTKYDALPHQNDLQALLRYVERYAYDEVGNIRHIHHSTTKRDGTRGPTWQRGYRYAPDSNRLQATTVPGDRSNEFGARFTYNTHGSMTSMPHLVAIDWDYADMITHADQLGGGDVYFAYGATGQRMRKVHVHNGIVEERIYLGGFEVYRKRSATPGAALDDERETLHVIDSQRRVAILETKTVTHGTASHTPTSRYRFQIDNHLGSATMEVDHEGRVISYEEYHAYGTTAFEVHDGNAEVGAKRYRYTGKEKDEETGLYYHGARYYAPWLGRWTTADPAGVVDGTNLYTYARGNPTMLKDPAGTECDPSIQSCSEPSTWVNPTPAMIAGLRSAVRPRAAFSINKPMRTLAGTPRSFPPGSPLKGPYNLWSNIPGGGLQDAAKAPGYIMEDTIFEEIAEAEAQRLGYRSRFDPNLNLPRNAGDFRRVWRPTSDALATRAGLSMETVTSSGLEPTRVPPHPDPRGSVQLDREIPRIRKFGGLMGGITIGSGVLTIYAASGVEDPIVRHTAQGAGTVEIVGGASYIAGSFTVGSGLVSSSTSAGLMTFGRVAGRFGGGVGMIALSGYSGYANLSTGNYDVLPADVGGLVSGGAVLAGSGPVAVAGLGVMAANYAGEVTEQYVTPEYGRTAGVTAGTTAGALVGAGIGAAVGAWGFGVGAVPGAIVGGIIGAGVGFIGSYW